MQQSHAILRLACVAGGNVAYRRINREENGEEAALNSREQQYRQLH